MRFSEEDQEIGTIILTLVVNLILGAGVYAYKSRPSVKTALATEMEKTVPTIVPSTPRF
jgi:hypothetical protein